MSLFQCENCGCCENTATSPLSKYMSGSYDWSGKESLKGMELCSACAPVKYNDGTNTGYGKWHGVFPRTFLPKGKFKTNRVGNLEHIETGSDDFQKFKLNKEEL